MCIVIDVNTIATVFNSSNCLHEEFKPVKDWILKRKGRMVYGGTKYNNELSKMSKYFKLVIELKKSGKAIEGNRYKIDRIHSDVKKGLTGRRYNDCHIIAIVIFTGCLLICSKDISSYNNIKNPKVYQPYGGKVPRIYRGKNNHNLLTSKRYVPKRLCIN